MAKDLIMKNNYNGRDGNGYQPLKSPKEIIMNYDLGRSRGKLAGLVIGSMICVPILLFVLFN
jgi:hypothetical protein